MTSKPTNKFSPEVRARAVRMVLDHEAEHPSRWAAIMSIAGKIREIAKMVELTAGASSKRAAPGRAALDAEERRSVKLVAGA